MKQQVQVQVCFKCGLPGSFRNYHKQCCECERIYLCEQRGINPQIDPDEKKELHRKLDIEIVRRRTAEKHLAMDRVKSVPCMDCGKTLPPYVMDFDHRDPHAKEANINYLFYRAPWSRIQEEIAKCDVVCVNCHRLRTWKARKPLRPLDSRRLLIGELKNTPCADCGEMYHFSQMDFDHVRGEKIREVSLMKSKKTILEEAAKCDVICANCHRERTQAKSAPRAKIDPEKMLWKQHRFGKLRTSYVKPTPPPTPLHQSWHDLAGTMIDRDVARLGNISFSVVCIYRKKMGIPRFKAPRPFVVRSWHQFVGKMPDLKVAELGNVTASNVSYFRRKQGIPLFQKKLEIPVFDPCGAKHQGVL
jgi:hypothetical protein